MVRAGEGAAAANEFREKSVVGIGWGGENWPSYSNRDAILQKLKQQTPEKTKRQHLAAASKIESFLRKLKVGDRVLTYDASIRTYLVGTIQSDALYEPKLLPRFPTVRKVDWQGEVRRDDVSVSTRDSLGNISTIWRVSEDGAQEIETLLSGKASLSPDTIDTDITDEQELLKDIQSRSHEFIKDQLSRLEWEQMQQLVAGLLRAMGYKTRISPQGPDRGKDIVASPDGFGFESPRIVVEVKHRRDAMSAQEIRGFIGGRHKDDKGLYVSTGGFTKDAHYEAERSTIPLTLMDLDELAKEIVEHYEKMDPEARALLPLRRIYWPT